MSIGFQSELDITCLKGHIKSYIFFTTDTCQYSHHRLGHRQPPLCLRISQRRAAVHTG